MLTNLVVTNKDAADCRSELLNKFKAISDGPCPNHWFPEPGTVDCPLADKPYQIQDKNGRTFVIRPIIYEALPYKGHSTIVFAWIGLPLDESCEKVPAMVLVHGGGGTAFKEWVELWVKRGYAAISIAVEGQTDEPLAPTNESTTLSYASTSQPGPRRQGVYGDWREAIEDQWIFHAVADTILARLLLADSCHVDSSKIGSMGISWGGIVACTVAGMTGDESFCHFISAYGCGNMAMAKSHFGRALKDNKLYTTVWDPCLYLSNYTKPSLWLSWPEDPTFPMNCFYTTYTSIKRGPVMVSLVPNLGHGHAPIWSRPDGYVFSEYLWNQGNDPSASAKNCWSKEIFCGAVRSETNLLTGTAQFYTAFPFQYAKLIWSPDSDEVDAANRRWNTVEAELSCTLPGIAIAKASFPGISQAWMMNFYTDTNLIVSSTYQSTEVQYVSHI